jgi:hypothetical protein
MRTLALTILTMGIVLAAGNAQAQTYDPGFPVCMHVYRSGGGAYYDCTYQTMGQCAASDDPSRTLFLQPFLAAESARPGRSPPQRPPLTTRKV